MKKLLCIWLIIISAIGIVPFASAEAEKTIKPMTVNISFGGEIIEMDTEEYALRVLLAESEICKSDEAKKALSVAARSVGAYFSLFGCKHEDFDACADGDCCIRLADISKFKKEEIDAAKAIVKSTYGESLVAESCPALALFTLCSGSSTRQSDIFSYLTPVARKAKCVLHKTEIEYTVAELYSRLGVDSGKEESFIYDDNGKCKLGFVGGRLFSGEDIASRLGLKSNELFVTVESEKVIAVSYGVGHGYGLDLCNASELASAGKGYREILQTYFPKLTINKIY